MDLILETLVDFLLYVLIVLLVLAAFGSLSVGNTWFGIFLGGLAVGTYLHTRRRSHDAQLEVNIPVAVDDIGAVVKPLSDDDSRITKPTTPNAMPQSKFLEDHWKVIFANRELWIEELGGWYFDEPTDKQLKYLADLEGVEEVVLTGDMTKGTVSDLIGIHIEADYEDSGLKIMELFGRYIQEGISETEVNVSVREIMTIPGNAEAWADCCRDNESAGQMLREQLRFFGENPPSNMTHKKAMALLDSIFRSNEKIADWDIYKDVWAKFEEEEFRKKHGIKKFSMKAYRDLVQVLYSEGIRLSNPKCSAGFLSERLLLLHPKLKRL